MNDGGNILIVGGSGYIGGYLKDNYLKDYCVYWTGTKDLTSKNYFRIDFNSESTFSCLIGFKFNIVIIFSSIVKGLDSIRLDETCLNVNAFRFSKFLQFLIDNSVASRLINISSMTVYDENNNSPVKENSTIYPTSAYGLSKFLAESIFEFNVRRNESLNGVTFRLPGVYGGKRKSGYIYSIICKCLSNRDIFLNTKGLLYWETIHVDDICSIIESFLKSFSWKNKYEKFNVCYGEKTDFIKTAFFIRDKMKSESHIYIEGEKGYIDFFLDNAKIKTVVDFDYSYEKSLIRYIRQITK